ncbi:MAG: prephenate dehydratase [Candidatus Poriferisodalaceae bacterium]|jgi:prephenate dehydratase
MSISASTKVGYLGPAGTFTEQALLSQGDLAGAQRTPVGSIPDTLHALVSGELDLAFVPIENGIEGAVNVTQDTLTFDIDVIIQREIVLDIQFNLLALPGTSLDEVHTVLSYPVALAQCRRFLRERLPDATVDIAASTADAARRIGEGQLAGVAAISSPLAAALYGLEPVAEAVEDHAGNQTRFLLLAREGVAPPSGHDKTSVVVFQRANQPGSLLAILQEFAARSINLTRLESRPTRQGLGNYCFVLDMEGHIDSELVGDCLRELKMTQGDVKFLGSYPAAGANGDQARRDSDANWRSSNDWLATVRSNIRG